MNQLEVRQIFWVILQAYNNFEITDDKVAIWADILADVPFTLAQRNLREYISQPENKFAPHPGVLAARPERTAEGRAILNAAETRLMLEAQEREWSKLGNTMPEGIRERVLKYVRQGNSDAEHP